MKIKIILVLESKVSLNPVSVNPETCWVALLETNIVSHVVTSFQIILSTLLTGFLHQQHEASHGHSSLL